MIITVGSENTDNSDANDFVNHFPDGIIIKPNSEIGLLNCTYNIEQGFVVTTGVNDAFEYSFPPRNIVQTVRVAPGDYTDIHGLAQAIQQALRNTQALVAVATPETAGLIQTANVHCSAQANAKTITLLVEWTPQTLPETHLVTTGANITAFVSGGLTGGVAGPGQGFFRKTVYNNTFQNKVITNDGNLVRYEAYAFGKLIATDPNKYFHVTRFNASQNDAEIAVGLANDLISTPDNSPMMFELQADGTFKIKERIAGVLTELAITAGHANYVKGDSFHIELPYQTPGGPARQPQYKRSTGGGPALIIPVDNSPARITVNPTFDLFPSASIKTPKAEGRVVTSTDLMTQNGLLGPNALTITQAGTGYADFERVEFTNGAGVGAVAYVRADPTTGALENIAGWAFENRGTGYVDGDILTCNGKVNGSVDGFVTVDGNNVWGAANITLAGTGYAVGNVLTGGNMQITVKTIDPAGGQITDFDITQGISGASGAANTLAFNDTLTFNNPGLGAQASIQFRCVTDYTPSLYALKCNGLVLNPNYHPLQENKVQTYRSVGPDALSPLIGFPTSVTGPNQGDNLNIVSSAALVPNNRTANNMLVHLDSFPLKSRHIGGEGRCVMALPFGDATDNTHTGLFSDRNFNLTYKSLENKQPENHNMMRVRITDAQGNKLQGIQHPVVINFDLRPKSL